MPINFPSKIVPKLDAFTGMVDADQIIGGGDAGTLPDACVSASNVAQHDCASPDVNHNVTTDLGITGDTGARTITSSDGTDAIIPVATTVVSGVMSKAMFDEHTANNAKVSDVNHNVTTNLSLGTKTATTIDVNSSDGTNATLTEADTTNAGILGSDKWDQIVANTAKVTNATHTGQVTGATSLALHASAITSQTDLASGIESTDEILISDAGVLKKADVSILPISTATQTALDDKLPLGGGALAGDITITDTTAPQLTLINTSGEQASFSVSGTGSLDIATAGDGTTDSDLTLDADGKIILDSATNIVRIVSSITMPTIAEGSLTSPEANSAQIWFDSDRSPYYRYRPPSGDVGPAKPILVEVKNDPTPELGGHLFNKTWSINLGLKDISTIQDEWRFITNESCDYNNSTTVDCSSAADVNIVVGMSVTGSENDPTDIPADNFITAITESGGAGTGTTSFELNVATQNGDKSRQTLTFGDVARTGAGINILHSGDPHGGDGDKSLVMSDWDASNAFVTNGYYVGDFLDGQNTNGLTVGQIITINGASWETVQGDNALATQWLGVCAVAHASKGVVLTRGYVRVASTEIVFSEEITSGAPMYISSDTDGHWTDLAPDSLGDIVRIAGHAVWGAENADEIEDEDTLMYFNPARTWVEL